LSRFGQIWLDMGNLGKIKAKFGQIKMIRFMQNEAKFGQK